MKYLVISDVHANLEALEAALAHARVRRDPACSATWSATAPTPMPSSSACAAWRRWRSSAATTTRSAAGIDGVESFNHLARHAISWTAIGADARES